ncbi:MAG: hypothetical protein PHC38_04115 [Weeksellaceae bacterium]|nr:hypothetical protein [Weeksellaceae bacterium]
MKSKQLILFLFFLIFQNCVISQTLVKIDKRMYGLNGNVNSLSENTMKMTYDENWNFSVDTVETYSIISNRYFDSEGIITKVEYIIKDSIKIGKTIFNYSNPESKIFSYQYDQNGEKIGFTEFLSVKDNVTKIRTVDIKTNKTTSKTFTKFKDGQPLWQKSFDTKANIYTEFIYYRNNIGQETEIKTIFGPKKDLKESTLKVKYLEFDKFGNWTKRVEYNPTKEKSCLLKTRKIIYYE